MSADAVIVVAGRPRLGKTALGLAFAKYANQFCPGIIIAEKALGHGETHEAVLASLGLAGDQHKHQPVSGKLPVHKTCDAESQWAGANQPLKEAELTSPTGDQGAVITTHPSVQGQLTQVHAPESASTTAIPQPQPEGDDRKAALVA